MNCVSNRLLNRKLPNRIDRNRNFNRISRYGKKDDECDRGQSCQMLYSSFLILRQLVYKKWDLFPQL